MISKVLIGMGHPAHFHLFRNTIDQLICDGVEVKVVITEKDILEKLLKSSSYDFIKIATRKNNEGLIDKVSKLIKSTKVLIKILHEFKPDLLIGSLTQLSFAGMVARIPVLFFGEDDISYTWMQCLVTYPFVDYIVAPVNTKVGFFKYKKIAYRGYQKLAYLHPEFFKPDSKLIPEINISEPYTIIRLVELKAYHDVNARGIDSDFLSVLLEKLSVYGKIYISSEKELPENLRMYTLPVKPRYVHHAIAYSSIFIGDSQSMCVEAAMLGVPSLKFNDFAGRISVLEELEEVYQLTYSFRTNQNKELLLKIDDILMFIDYHQVYQERRWQMLNEKINVTKFYVWFVENYPDSVSIVKKDNGFMQNF